MKYRPEIDGLRALAVVPVVLFHAGISATSGGYVGVDVFFVISGYLITRLLIEDLDRERFSLLSFYDRRVRRIFPALITIITISSIAGWFILLPEDFERFSLSAVAASTFWSNIFFWMESGYFDTATELKPLLHTWSLALEEQYYIFFPILLAAFWRLGRGIILVLLGIIFVLSMTLGIWNFGTLSEPEAAFYLLPTRAWELLIGSFVAFYLTRPNPRLPNKAISAVASVFGMALILFAVVAYDKGTPFPSQYTLAPTLGTALILLFERQGTWSFRILANPVFIAIGSVSYSAYLWHQPLFAYARYLSPNHPETWVMVALCGATFVLAWISFRFIEQPFRDRSRFTRKQIFLGTGTAGTILVIFGLVATQLQGVPQRYAPQHRAVFAQYDNPGHYVRTAFRSYSLAEFNRGNPDDKRQKLLIIGDSFAEDMVNAILETGLSKRYQLSTFRISSRCGNLYLKWDFSNLRDARDREMCAKRDGYANQKLQVRMKEADEIWLVSRWEGWHAMYLPESLYNIMVATTAKVRVMGRKNFGSDMSLKRYMQAYLSGNTDMTMSISRSHSEINALMKSTLPADNFVDISKLLCGERSDCKNLTKEGLLISYDGNHLTQAGARLMGTRLLLYLDANTKMVAK